jgi:hypothetical protein
VLQDSGEKLVVAETLLEREMNRANIPSLINLCEEFTTALARGPEKVSLILVLLLSLRHP